MVRKPASRSVPLTRPVRGEYWEYKTIIAASHPIQKEHRTSKMTIEKIMILGVSEIHGRLATD